MICTVEADTLQMRESHLPALRDKRRVVPVRLDEDPRICVEPPIDSVHSDTCKGVQGNHRSLSYLIFLVEQPAEHAF